MGSSFINLTMLSYPPISRTFDDFSRTDFGTCPPDRSSIAAGRLSDARTLHKRHAHTHSTFSLSLQQMYFPPSARAIKLTYYWLHITKLVSKMLRNIIRLKKMQCNNFAHN